MLLSSLMMFFLFHIRNGKKIVQHCICCPGLYLGWKLNLCFCKQEFHLCLIETLAFFPFNFAFHLLCFVCTSSPHFFLPAQTFTFEYSLIFVLLQSLRSADDASKDKADWWLWQVFAESARNDAPVQAEEDRDGSWVGSSRYWSRWGQILTDMGYFVKEKHIFPKRVKRRSKECMQPMKQGGIIPIWLITRNIQQISPRLDGACLCMLVKATTAAAKVCFMSGQYHFLPHRG